MTTFAHLRVRLHLQRREEVAGTAWMGEPFDLPSEVVELDVTPETSIADLARSLSPATFPEAFVFVSPTDPSGKRRIVLAPNAVVEPTGELRWLREEASAKAGVTISALQRTSTQGLFDGDPTTFLINEEGFGGNGGGPEDWDVFLKALSAGLGLIGLLRMLGRDLRKAVREIRFRYSILRVKRFLKRNRQRWIDRDALYPAWVMETVNRRERWNVHSFAKLFRVEVSQARKFLRRLGYEPIEGSDRVALSDDPEKARVREFVRESSYVKIE